MYSLFLTLKHDGEAVSGYYKECSNDEIKEPPFNLVEKENADKFNQPYEANPALKNLLKLNFGYYESITFEIKDIGV